MHMARTDPARRIDTKHDGCSAPFGSRVLVYEQPFEIEWVEYVAIPTPHSSLSDTVTVTNQACPVRGMTCLVRLEGQRELDRDGLRGHPLVGVFPDVVHVTEAGCLPARVQRHRDSVDEVGVRHSVSLADRIIALRHSQLSREGVIPHSVAVCAGKACARNDDHENNHHYRRHESFHSHLRLATWADKVRVDINHPYILCIIYKRSQARMICSINCYYSFCD